LLAELDHVSEEGIAVDDEELALGLVGIAASVRDEGREVAAAIDLAAHVCMIALPDLVDQFLPHLLATADQISARLGYRRDDETGGEQRLVATSAGSSPDRRLCSLIAIIPNLGS
jgi:hypothetical protein